MLAHDQVIAYQISDGLGNGEIFDEVGVQDRELRAVRARRGPGQAQRAGNSILRVKAPVELVQAATQDIADGVRHAAPLQAGMRVRWCSRECWHEGVSDHSVAACIAVGNETCRTHAL